MKKSLFALAVLITNLFLIISCAEKPPTIIDSSDNGSNPKTKN